MRTVVLHWFACSTIAIALTQGGMVVAGELIEDDLLVPASHTAQVSCDEVGQDSGLEFNPSLVSDASFLSAPTPGFDPTGELVPLRDPPNPAGQMSYDYEMFSEDELDWLESIKVGYDRGFVIASRRELDLRSDRYPFQLRFNGWGQLRHSISEFDAPNQDLNQFQLKRGRLLFSGGAFNPDFTFFIQLDGRSSSGDDMRLLDYYLDYDFGHDQFGLTRGTIGLRTGKYKVPFTIARWLSGRDFEFADRSMSSTFFDVNRSFAWGLFGQTMATQFPIKWEIAIFNGLVTGGAETGSSGSLDGNFAYSGRIFALPIGDWGNSHLPDFENHRQLAMRVGGGFAYSEIDKSGTTEFSRLRVVDTGQTLVSLFEDFELDVESYHVALFAVDASWKYRGWSSTIEYYFRHVNKFRGADVPDLFDHGFWLQIGKFVVPRKIQLAARWSRVVGNSGSFGMDDLSSDEIGGAVTWHIRENHSKVVIDAAYLNGAPVDSDALDLSPGDRGWLLRSQVQFSF
ncbi:MAG: hypothetical protein GY904_15100 [Planctomycetaceae bacterium]|nr:hypothetical protein [Planctomycetaceae bacterium]